MNYTRPANEYTHENIFVIGRPYDLAKKDGGPVDHAECGKITRYLRTEIERIIAKSKPFSPWPF